MTTTVSRLLVAAFTAASTISGCSGSQPTEPGPDSSIQEQLQDALDSVFVAQRGKGISAAVILPDGDLWLSTAEAEGATRVLPENLFWIGSVTKMFTATVVLQLIQEGVLHFDDQLHQFLPKYEFVDSTITIRQLLDHTSGVADFVNHPRYNELVAEAPDRIWSPEEVVTRLFFEPYNAPGEAWRYSSGGYLLLGMVIEAVTGNRLSEEYRTRILQPLGLTHTFLDCQETIAEGIVSAWEEDANGVLVEWDVNHAQRHAETSMGFAAGGLFSTAGDVAVFTDALFGRKVLLSQPMLNAMLDFNRNIPADFGWPGYGLGVAEYRTSMVSGAYAYGSAGQAAMFISATAYLPNWDSTITVLLNAQNWGLWEGAVAALANVVVRGAR